MRGAWLGVCPEFGGGAGGGAGEVVGDAAAGLVPGEPPGMIKPDAPGIPAMSAVCARPRGGSSRADRSGKTKIGKQERKEKVWLASKKFVKKVRRKKWSRPAQRVPGGSASQAASWSAVLRSK